MTNLLLLVPRRKGQQSDIASLLDGTRQSALMGGADAGKTARHNLAPLRYKLLQQANVAIVDRIDLLDAEFANLLAAEELASPTARPCGACAGRASARAAGT
jgi:hypothetical protein